jgi:hypothetical protein
MNHVCNIWAKSQELKAFAEGDHEFFAARHQGHDADRLVTVKRGENKRMAEAAL